MTHQDHVTLIRDGISQKGGVWADLGSGSGSFTLALRDIAGPEVEIYSVDKDSTSLSMQKHNFDEDFPGTNIHYLEQNFTQDLELPPLDGIIMANSLHFVPDQRMVLKKLVPHLKKDGRLIVVEYNSDAGNMWVPFPFSFESFKKLALSGGFQEPKLLKTVPSNFLNEIYSALTFPA